MTTSEDAVTKTYRKYFDAFQTLSPAAVMPYLHLPFMIVTPLSVAAVTTAAEARTLLATMMHALKSRGYASSECANLTAKPLSHSTALVSARVVRFKVDGEELEQFGATYLFRHTDGAWRIAVLITHDPD